MNVIGADNMRIVEDAFTYRLVWALPELVVHFFREIVGVAEVSKEALSQRTAD